MAYFGRNLRQCPPSCGIACEDQFRSVREPLASESSTWDMGGARSQRSSGKRQREAFSLQRLRDALSKAVPEQRNERLSPRVYPQTLAAEGSRRAAAQQGPRRQLVQQGAADDKVQTRIAARHRMTDAVAVTVVEKQHLIRFGNGLITSQMSDERPAIREHQVGRSRGFFVAPMSVATLATHIADRDANRLEERLSNNLSHTRDLASV
jgi:hypothetical protein